MKNMTPKIIAFGLAAFAVTLFATPSHAFVINGKLADWGVSAPFGSLVPASGIASTIENDQAIVPGGQSYDAEAMYAAFDSQYLYFAVVTGHPNVGTSGGSIRPGDIAFDFGGDGSYEYGIETVNRGSLTAGSLYAVDSWKYASLNSDTPTEINASNPLNYSFLGSGTLAYNSTYFGTSHYVIEGKIDHGYFGGDWGSPFVMSWTQTCGNDVIKLKMAPVPEPASMILFGLGLGGLGMLRRRQA